ncbi:hypothetical protein SAY87_001487 [Trapa incisa]|uniref:Molybdenum cofactor sulfurase n=1 Tax=Trapa incisa TaxID=236973 RepID=A0AAN7GDM9_9MYRT|nr:hypothetical protein SAY87_001487 [Trapa incisa]
MGSMKLHSDKMHKTSQSGEATSQVCLLGCCPTPLLGMSKPPSSVSGPRSSMSESRRNFAAAATSSIFPNVTQFTNHESLPSFKQSYSEFTAVYPKYSDADRIDQIRDRDYFHLSLCNKTCLDYIGIGLFSYSQLHRSERLNSSRTDEAAGSTSSPQPQVPRSDFPFFSITYKTGNLKTLLLHGGQESELESSMKKRIMNFLNISETDYSMVFTANRTSAFKLVAESYPFQTSRKLLTVYDYESEAVEAMINSSEKRGARVMSAEFTWPRLRIHVEKLKKMLVRKKTRKKKKIDMRGLFVFPIHSRVTGSRYPYLWMNMAQDNGWHVLLDACALDPKDMDSFGLSLLCPDFVVCSFYKVFGENPSGFGCLFVKKSTIPILDASTSLGIVCLIPAIERKLLQLPGETEWSDISNSNSFSGPISVQMDLEISKASDEGAEEHERKPLNSAMEQTAQETIEGTVKSDIKCDGLDHVDAMGMITIGSRGRCLINWLVNALLKLEHPNREGARLIRIYGPKIKFDRGPALAFNVFDWKGEKVEPPLVQKLADRSNISLSYGFLHHLWFSDKYEVERLKVLEKRPKGLLADGRRKQKANPVVMAVTLALSFLTSFEDVYRLWAFLAQFLDADFVEKERWRYTALNQKTVEV